MPSQNYSYFYLKESWQKDTARAAYEALEKSSTDGVHPVICHWGFAPSVEDEGVSLSRELYIAQQICQLICKLKGKNVSLLRAVKEQRDLGCWRPPKWNADRPQKAPSADRNGSV